MPAHLFADTSNRERNSNHSQMGGKNCDDAKQGTSEEQETNQDLGYHQPVSSLQK
jgi:hypothetical protein